MGDRELLELAGKAVGYKFHMLDYEKYPIFIIGGLPIEWNPLEDDGDALRLAVVLRFNIDCSLTACVTVWYPGNNHTFERCEQQTLAEATRRAIVRAAAEIGRSMP